MSNDNQYTDAWQLRAASDPTLRADASFMQWRQLAQAERRIAELEAMIAGLTKTCDDLERKAQHNADVADTLATEKERLIDALEGELFFQRLRRDNWHDKSPEYHHRSEIVEALERVQAAMKGDTHE